MNRRDFLKASVTSVSMAALGAGIAGAGLKLDNKSASFNLGKRRPNVIYIMADDHASMALSCYGSYRNQTPNLDKIAKEGIRLDNCFCTNSICTPSRATILTGTYNHINGVTTLDTPMDNRLPTYPKLLKQAGYQTAIVGKWHLGQGPKHEPTGFDFWRVLPGQGG